MFKKKISLSLIAVVVTTLLWFAPLQAADTFKIAVFEPLSGPLKYLGDLTVSSLKFYADEYNEKGGLLG
ncbi:MAG: branched-chain amino acid ABC transporter substrate-binding protein, partial [Desulfobacula sp.]